MTLPRSASASRRPGHVADGVHSARADGSKVTYGDGPRRRPHREGSPRRPNPSRSRPTGCRQGRSRASTSRTKVDRRVAYVQDLRLPGVERPRGAAPNVWGKIEALDEAKLKALPGVLPCARAAAPRAVIAEREEAGDRASAALGQTARWTAAAAAVREPLRHMLACRLSLCDQ